MELYIQWFHEGTKNKRIENPERYISEGLKIISKFLGDTQKYEYDIAPTTNVRLLIFPGDKPKVKKSPMGKLITFLILYWNNYSLILTNFIKTSYRWYG